jgi:hypothetical protein
MILDHRQFVNVRRPAHAGGEAGEFLLQLD